MFLRRRATAVCGEKYDCNKPPALLGTDLAFSLNFVLTYPQTSLAVPKRARSRKFGLEMKAQVWGLGFTV